jgi:signal transduction histidine kinase
VFAIVARPLAVCELVPLAIATLVASTAYYGHSFLVALVLGIDLGLDPRQVWARNFKWLYPHYLILGLMGLGLAVASVTLGIVGTFLFFAPPLMMRVVLQQYTARTGAVVERLEAANADLLATSDQLRRRGEDLALLSELGQVVASEPQAARVPQLVVSRCVPTLGDACALVWLEPPPGGKAVHSAADVEPATDRLRWLAPEALANLGASIHAQGGIQTRVDELRGDWLAAPLEGAGRATGWVIAWRHAAADGWDARSRLALAQEVGRRVAQALEHGALLEEAATVEALRTLDRAKTDFLAMAAHELRTPLTSLQGYAELLRTQDVEPSLRERWLDILRAESAQLGLFLDQLLDVSRVETGRFQANRRPIAVQEVAESVLTVFEAEASLSGHRFEVAFPPDLPRAYADAAQIERVMRNLVSNALKYAPGGGPVHLRATLTTSGDLELCVADTGLGIPPEWLPRLFQRFARVEAPERATIRGTGLGLYISRQLVELNGGRIWASSAGVGRGATFHFTLPQAPPRLYQTFT